MKKSTTQYRTAGGVNIKRHIEDLDYKSALNQVLADIDTRRGAVFASGYEYPGRYSRWDVGFVDPPVEFMAQGRNFTISALNERGQVLLRIFRVGLANHPHLTELVLAENELCGRVAPMPEYFSEEERSHQPTIFSVLRALTRQFHSAEDGNLGFYGALGYDLVFQFEPIALRHARPEEQADLHLFFPDQLIVVDHRQERAFCSSYDFQLGEFTTAGALSGGAEFPFRTGLATGVASDHAPGEYADKVRQVIAGARRGDWFEVVLSQVLSAGFTGTPSQLFNTIRRLSPSPYEFLINLGPEQLVGASPEMFVRVEGAQVETCPISGTISRGQTPLEDAEQILKLLNSGKDRAELTMCTDVDRNDKSRVCQPGTVRVLARRLIETYARLFHTVDHVAGELRVDCDAFDALLSHMWACTLTGAPKPAAMQTVENLENSARRWYGGCVGMLLCNGNINTGITIRTVHLEGGKAWVRVGATLLADSDPEEEEGETRLKAAAFIGAVLGEKKPVLSAEPLVQTGRGKKVLFVDNRDSFVQTLAGYVRQIGASVTTLRAGFPYNRFDELRPDLVFISPGPGTPEEFGVPKLVKECVARGLPVFGVCLGLQGIVEAFGGQLGVLPEPVHGKCSKILNVGEGILAGLPRQFMAGRYHSLYALPESLPDCLRILARAEDGVIMAIQHKSYPAAAVQFHPESIMSMQNDVGLRLIAQAVKVLTERRT